MTKAKRKAVLEKLKKDRVRFLRLTFTDIMGIIKNVEVPQDEFEKAVDGQIMFDGSSVEGFARIEESDMLLKPDLDTYVLYPWQEATGKVARLICDIYNPDETPFQGCPRQTLKRACDKARKMGYVMQAGPEPEFFLFMRGENGQPTTRSHDRGGYFDLAPIDRGEDARRAIVNVLDSLGFAVEAAHHEVAPAQHEIDFRHRPALECADSIATFRFVVRKVALDFGLHATFMPKPIFGINGSGMHVHQSLYKNGKNAFFDKKAPDGLSPVARGYIAGVLRHCREFCAVTNPLVNSYKRLVPGYEAPTHIAWSERNRSPLCRIPATRGRGSRMELRSPDPSCNPYLALAVILGAGLHGIEMGMTPPPAINENIYRLTHEEREKRQIGSLPGDLSEALRALRSDPVISEILGEHCMNQFLKAKEQEWQRYIAYISQWELDQYLTSY